MNGESLCIYSIPAFPFTCRNQIVNVWLTISSLFNDTYKTQHKYNELHNVHVAQYTYWHLNLRLFERLNIRSLLKIEYTTYPLPVQRLLLLPTLACVALMAFFTLFLIVVVISLIFLCLLFVWGIQTRTHSTLFSSHYRAWIVRRRAVFFLYNVVHKVLLVNAIDTVRWWFCLCFAVTVKAARKRDCSDCAVSSTNAICVW